MMSRIASKSNYLVEVVGTFILVYAIVSAATTYRDSGTLGVIGIGLVHAFVLAAIVYAIAYKSGAHVNPAVTIGMLIAGKIRRKQAGLYIICQVIGGIIGAAVAYSIFGSAIAASVTVPSEGNVVRALILEVVMTFTLVYVVMATTTDKNFKSAFLAGLAIGLTLGLNVMFGAPISGGSLNPARSFGPAVVTGDFSFNWLYWVAPITGGIIAAAVYKGLHKDTGLPSDIETRIPVIEERMQVSKRVSTEEATITKEPMTETKTVEVPVTHEEMTVERISADRRTSERPSSTKTEVKIPLSKEEVRVTKEPYVKEEVVVKKEPVTETRTVSDTVTSERVDVEGKKRKTED
jgi:MIP family channel proteins